MISMEILIGGPLQCRFNQTAPWILVGITSFGSGCALEGYPDVFMNILFYRSWIDNVMSSN